MAETKAGQATFGWAGEEAAPGAPQEAAQKAPGAREAGQAPKARLPPLPPDDELWDVRAAARYLKRSVSWVYHRAEDGTLPVRRLGGWGLRFIPSEVRAWVETGGVAPARRRE